MRIVAFFLAAALAAPLARAGEPRVVSVGGDITEIVYALGAETLLVGADTSSLFPDAATKLPMVGYQRALSAEGVLSLNPTLVLATDAAGPPATLEQLRGAGVKIVTIPADHSIEGARKKIAAVAEALDRDAAGRELLARFDASVARARAFTSQAATRPTVLFVYARGGSVINVSGTGTAADAMIALAGGTNAVTEFENFRPLTAEGAVKAAPEWLLIPGRGLESIGGGAAFLSQPGLALTPAGKEKRIVAMDDLLLLGFGPRLGEAILELAQAIHRAPQGPDAR